MDTTIVPFCGGYDYFFVFWWILLSNLIVATMPSYIPSVPGVMQSTSNVGVMQSNGSGNGDGNLMSNIANVVTPPKSGGREPEDSMCYDMVGFGCGLTAYSASGDTFHDIFPKKWPFFECAHNVLTRAVRV